MRLSQAEATTRGRLERLAEPITEMKDRLAGAVGDARHSLVGARDSAGDAIAESPLRWTLLAFAAGLIVGALIGYRRADY